MDETIAATPEQDFSKEEPILPDAAPKTAGTESPAETEPVRARDYAAEAAELLSARPELVGQTLPDEVMRAAVENGVPLLQAWLDHEQSRSREEIARLREENRVYRQNAEAARRGPVQGVAYAGEDAEADPFLSGFTGSGW